LSAFLDRTVQQQQQLQRQQAGATPPLPPFFDAAVPPATSVSCDRLRQLAQPGAAPLDSDEWSVAIDPSTDRPTTTRRPLRFRDLLACGATALTLCTHLPLHGVHSSR
jgi:hypothetical protein